MSGNNQTRAPNGAAKSVPEWPANGLQFEFTESQKKYLCYLLKHKQERMTEYDAHGGTFKFQGDGGRWFSLDLSTYEAGGLFKAGNAPWMTPVEVLQFAKQKRLEEMQGEAAAAAARPATVAKRCAACTGIQDEAMKKCGRCKNVYYCGQVCQRVDWPEHKKVCVPSKQEE